MRKVAPIDFVVTWVDDKDPLWLEQRNEYAAAEAPKLGVDSDQTAMFQDHGMLRYWFRAVERYAPWVRTIHFVNADQVPSWLDTAHRQLNCVSHREIIDEKYLPTFSPRPIQAGFANIPGLAENFVVFDDDTFLNQEVSPEFFFPRGLPYGLALPNALALRSAHSHGLLNVSGVLNEHFSQRQVLRRHWRKWLSPRYGKELYRSLALLPWPYIMPFAISHLPIPLRRSVMMEAYSAAEEDISATMSRRFRDNRDVLPIALAAGWQCVTGQFTPVGRKQIGQSFDMGADPIAKMTRSLGDPSIPMICFNDSTSVNTTGIGQKLASAMETKYSDLSSFEKF